MTTNNTAVATGNFRNQSAIGRVALCIDGRAIITMYDVKEIGLMRVLWQISVGMELYDICEKFTAAVIDKARWMQSVIHTADERSQSQFRKLMKLEGQKKWNSDVVGAANSYKTAQTGVFVAGLTAQFGENVAKFGDVEDDRQSAVDDELCKLLASILCN